MVVISFQEQNLPMPGNVNLVIGSLSDLASFNVLPTDTILRYCFNFTDTELPGVGFESLGVTNKRLIFYLGQTFLIMVMSLILYLLYGLVLLLMKRFAALTWLE
jgi:hypothetical protein